MLGKVQEVLYDAEGHDLVYSVWAVRIRHRDDRETVGRKQDELCQESWQGAAVRQYLRGIYVACKCEWTIQTRNVSIRTSCP